MTASKMIFHSVANVKGGKTDTIQTKHIEKVDDYCQQAA